MLGTIICMIQQHMVSWDCRTLSQLNMTGARTVWDCPFVVQRAEHGSHQHPC